jgi:endogenous inhibitor of DNA gyrase (YacG/DUF329 family)
MSDKTANCPNCGAPVTFLWSSAVQTTCPFCKSILVRRDVDLEKVGVVADLPLDSSPIQIGTEGIFEKKAFVVVGRILYEYDRGGWNEWHLIFNDGTSGWLSDAQDEYAISFLRAAPAPLPAANTLQPGQSFSWFGHQFCVTVVTPATYGGVEGELPFEYWNKKEVPFADLLTTDARFATIDYSETQPLLFIGQAVEYDDLKLKNVREFGDAAGPGKAVLTRAFNCPHCGAAMVMHAVGHTLNVVCESCNSILDAKDESLQVLGRFENKMRFTPLVPLGSRGKMDGVDWEVIGTQVRTTTSEGISYSWSEYLLFNPYKGFRYLTHYQGHWNYVKTVHSLPVAAHAGLKAAVEFQGVRYTHFQTANACTTFVAGEFPWQVHSGDHAEVRDYVAPPLMLSSEASDAEINWSLGRYVSGQEIWQAFKVPGQPPVPVGVFANQPNPLEQKSHGMWGLFSSLFLGMILLLIVFTVISSKDEVLSEDYTFTRGQGEASFVTDQFELKGRTSNVELAIETDLQNHWAYFNFALINESTGQAFDFGREVGFYADSDGDEGSRNDTVIIPSVPAGRYYLRVEPETPDAAFPVHYHLRLRRDVPVYGYFWVAAILLMLPPIFSHWRVMSFEGRRWMESDYASSGGSQ